VALVQTATAGTSEATSVIEGISEVRGDDLEGEAVGVTIVGIELGSLNVNIEVQETTGRFRHFVMIEVGIVIDGSGVIASEVADHHHLKAEVDHQITVLANPFETPRQARIQTVSRAEARGTDLYPLPRLLMLCNLSVVDTVGDEELADAEGADTMTIFMVGIHHRILIGIVEHSHRQHLLHKFLLLVLPRQAYLPLPRLLNPSRLHHQSLLQAQPLVLSSGCQFRRPPVHTVLLRWLACTLEEKVASWHQKSGSIRSLLAQEKYLPNHLGQVPVAYNLVSRALLALTSNQSRHCLDRLIVKKNPGPMRSPRKELRRRTNFSPPSRNQSLFPHPKMFVENAGSLVASVPLLSHLRSLPQLLTMSLMIQMPIRLTLSVVLNSWRKTWRRLRAYSQNFLLLRKTMIDRCRTSSCSCTMQVRITRRTRNSGRKGSRL